MLPNFIRKVIPLIFLSLITLCHAQVYTTRELNKITNDYVQTGDINKALKINFEALNDFITNNNIEGSATVYINIAGLLWNVNQFKEGLYYLDKAKNLLVVKKNTKLEAKLYNEYGRIYTSLDLFKQSNIQLNKALCYVRYIPKEHENIYLYQIYFKKWMNFEMLNQKDSAYIMRNKSLKALPASDIYSKIAQQFIKENKHLDSADYYMKKMFSEGDQNIVYNKSQMFKTRGDLHKAKGDNTGALNDYLSYLQLSKKINKKSDIRDAYEKLSTIYKDLGDHEKRSEFLENYKSLNDSIKKEEKITMRFIVNKVNQEKEQKEEKLNRLVFIISGIVFISGVLLYFIKKNYSRRQSKKDELLAQKSKELNVLEKKVNISFQEVIELAKNNDPFFITRFKEVYPEFYEELLKLYPKLTSNDIKLAAYIRLNLSNKEIATFENLTFRTVATKRYRLKKRLGLDPDSDLVEWINNL